MSLFIKTSPISWHEILQLFASILSEEEEYEELKELFRVVMEAPDILYLNYALAGHCLAEIDTDVVDWSDEILRKVVHQFEENFCKSSFIEVFVHLGGRAVDPLLDLLQKTNDNYLKWAISEALGRIGDPRAVDPLLDLLQETDSDDLKGRISEALGGIGDPTAVDPLLDLLQKTNDNLLKRAISEALGRIEGQKTIDHLLDLLQKTNDNYRLWRISEALGRIGDPTALDPLLDLLQKTNDNYLKGRISLALGEIGDPRAVDPLLDLLQKTNDNYLKMRISYALGRIQDPRAVDPLLDLLQKTDNDDLIWAISEALGFFNPLYLYPFMENQMLQSVILDALCSLSTEFNIRFFINKLVLPEGDILHIKTEAQQKHSTKKLDKILRIGKE